jgi:hypothetical protein
MWPTPADGEGARGWSALDRRARATALVVTAAVGLAIAATTWVSVRHGQPSSPVYDGGAAPSSTWTWDGTAYAAAAAGAAGPRSNDADLAYDRARGVLVLWDHGCGRLVMGFTGGCVDPVNQTWTWDGRAWTPRSARSAPTAAGRGAMVYDTRRGEVLYVNGAGEAWAWNGTDWLRMAMEGGPAVPRPGSAATRATFAIGYDEARGLLVYALSSGTWSWDGRAWTASPAGLDAAEAGPAARLVYDRARAQLVYVGGRSTWTWDGASWRPHEQPAIASGTVAYDPVRETVVLVREDASACDRAACRTTTWTWDSRSWTRRPVEGGGPALPLSRSGASDPPMAFDEARGVMVLFASGS